MFTEGTLPKNDCRTNHYLNIAVAPVNLHANVCYVKQMRSHNHDIQMTIVWKFVSDSGRFFPGKFKYNVGTCTNNQLQPTYSPASSCTCTTYTKTFILLIYKFTLIYVFAFNYKFLAFHFLSHLHLFSWFWNYVCLNKYQRESDRDTSWVEKKCELKT